MFPGTGCKLARRVGKVNDIWLLRKPDALSKLYFFAGSFFIIMSFLLSII